MGQYIMRSRFRFEPPGPTINPLACPLSQPKWAAAAAASKVGQFRPFGAPKAANQDGPVEPPVERQVPGEQSKGAFGTASGRLSWASYLAGSAL